MSIEPGVYLNLAPEVYHADTAVSASGIKKLLQSPFKYWWGSGLNPKRPAEEHTTAKTLGSAYHALILEPEEFAKRFTVKPGVKSSGVRDTIGQGDFEMIQAMSDVVYQSEKRAELLSGGFAEVSVFWRDPATGVMCKVRYDWLAPLWSVDLKSLADNSTRALRYEIPRMGFDITAALYSEGAMQMKAMVEAGYELPEPMQGPWRERFLAMESHIFIFMIQEKEEPYIVRTMSATQPIIDVGMDKVRAGLTIYQNNAKQYGDAPWETGYGELEDLCIEDLSESINYF